MKLLAPLLALAAFNILLAACGEAGPMSTNPPTAAPTATQDSQLEAVETPTFTPASTPTRPPPNEGAGAQIGDHWHASIYVEICGMAIYFPPSPGGVHSHGDGLIHIHPEDASEAGDQANLGRFFDSFPYDIDTNYIMGARGELFENGDACPNGLPGRVQVIANGKDVTEDLRSYILQDEDVVEVYFR